MSIEELIKELSAEIHRYERLLRNIENNLSTDYLITISKSYGEIWHRLKKIHYQAQQVQANEATKQLKKINVPKDLGEWLECNKDNIAKSNMLFTLIDKLGKAYVNNKFSDFTDAYIQEYKKELIEVLVGTRDYEVEEEPKYYIIDKNDEVLWYRDNNGIPKLSGSTLRSVLKSNSKDRYQFTEQEIKDYDERFLPFKVPVEVEE